MNLNSNTNTTNENVKTTTNQIEKDENINKNHGDNNYLSFNTEYPDLPLGWKVRLPCSKNIPLMYILVMEQLYFSG
jgi:hypothetical protein